MQTLKELAVQMRNLSEVANRDLAGWDIRTLAGAQTAKRHAQDELARISVDYRNRVAAAANKVFLTGSPASAESVLKALKDEFVVVRGDEIYRTLAKNIERQLSPLKRQFGMGALNQISEDLEILFAELDLSAVPSIRFDPNKLDTTVAEFDDVVAMVRDVVRANFGDDVNRHFIERSVYLTATSRFLDDTSVPVIVTGLIAIEANTLAMALFPGRPSTVINLDDLDKKTVVKTAKALIFKALGTTEQVEPKSPVIDTKSETNSTN